MRTFSFALMISISIFMLSACGKPGREFSSGSDHVEALFNQLKHDPDYKAYYRLLSTTAEMIIINSRKSGKTDTAVLHNKDLSWKEKYDTLNYSNYSAVENNTMQMYRLHNILSNKYPDFKNLTGGDNKKLVMLSKKYYDKLINK